jgi:hypothetical protein
VIALCRYVADDTSRSLRWVAPVLVFSIFEGIFDATSGQVLATYAASASLMFLVAIWLGVVVCNTESEVQEDITSVTVGGRARVRIAKMIVAVAACLLLSVIAVCVPPIVSDATTPLYDIVTGLIALSLTVLFGVSLGSLCSRPIIERTAWAVLVGALVGLADIVIPDGPPTRQLLVLLNETAPRHLLALVVLIALESAVISFVLVVASLRIMRDRA